MASPGELGRPSAPDCLAGGGEMGALMRAVDWAATPLGPLDALAAEPADRGQHLPRLALPDRPLLGAATTSCSTTTRTPDPRQEAPVGARPALPGGVVRDLGRDRADARRRDGHRRSDVVRGSAAAPRAPRLPGGMLLHLLVQPGPRRRRRRRRHLHRRDREHRRVLGERRLRTLRELGGTRPRRSRPSEACRIAATDAGGRTAPTCRSRCSTCSTPRAARRRWRPRSGWSAGSPASPADVELDAPGMRPAGRWPRSCRTGEPVVVGDLTRALGPLPGGPWPESARSALVLPLAAPGQERLAGVLVAGVEPAPRARRRVPRLLRAGRAARSPPPSPTRAPTRTSGGAPRRWPSSTAPRPRSSAT